MIWRFLGLTVVGMVGMVAALRPWLEEFTALADRLPDDDDRKVTWAERRPLLLWAGLVILFGSSAITGIVGIIFLA